MNVCHLIGALGYGGRETLLFEIFKNSPDHISYTLCCLRVNDRELADEFEKVGVDVVSVDADGHTDVNALWELVRFLWRREFDVLHAHGINSQIPGRLFGHLCGIECIISTYHGLKDVNNTSKFLRIEELTRRLDSKHVAVSNGVKQSFTDGSSDGQWTTIYNGIDIEAFNARVRETDIEPIKDQYDLDEDAVIFLNVGRYIPKEAQSDLIEAMDVVVEEIPEARLFIVGGRGLLENQLRNNVADAGLARNIEITGRVPTVAEYYALADVFVSSSVSEGLPIVLLEAMAAELPIIATDIPGVEEVLDTGTGEFVGTHAPSELAEAMIRLGSDKQGISIGKAGYERATDRFGIQRTIKEHIELYKDCAKI